MHWRVMVMLMNFRRPRWKAETGMIKAYQIISPYLGQALLHPLLQVRSSNIVFQVLQWLLSVLYREAAPWAQLYRCRYCSNEFCNICSEWACVLFSNTLPVPFLLLASIPKHRYKDIPHSLGSYTLWNCALQNGHIILHMVWTLKAEWYWK